MKTQPDKNTKVTKPAPHPLKNQRTQNQPVAPTSNAAFNAQSRRVLAQHYRAKYGVK